MILNFCYVCGLPKSMFEKQQKGDGWSAHIYRDHYVYNYLAFVLYLETLDLDKCNGIEKFVKD